MLRLLVLLPYEITLFSNGLKTGEHSQLFYYLMKLHYSQTIPNDEKYKLLFYYLMKLHYSQTFKEQINDIQPFYYLMKLHYSQTVAIAILRVLVFYYLMKLHYSQTSNKLCHYNAQGNSQDIVYIIVLIIITVNNTQIRVQNMYLFKF